MNGLLFEIRRSLTELDLGLKGDLSISEPMEILMNALFDDKVPDSWAQRAWPSLRPLASWLQNVLERHKQLEAWTADLVTPKVTWLSGLFNPQAFLTAVMQVTARKNELPLDKLVTAVDVTKKSTRRSPLDLPSASPRSPSISLDLPRSPWARLVPRTADPRSTTQSQEAGRSPHSPEAGRSPPPTRSVGR